MESYTISDLLEGGERTETIEVYGWVRTHRQSKNVGFVELNDGTSVRGLQLVVDPGLESYRSVSAQISTGACIAAKGVLRPSPAKGQRFELDVKEIRLVGDADPETYPLQKKGHSLEFLREIIHLRPRSNTLGAVMRVRSKVSYAIHQFFQERGFHYVNAPVITTSDCEGAGEMFRVTTLDLQNLPKDGSAIRFSEDFFHESAHLTVSGQLEAEIYAMALRNVYTFAPTFRAENSNTTRHLAEFWMIEPEIAFAGLAENMQLAEAFIKSLLRAALTHCSDDLTFLHAREWSSPAALENLQQVADSEFKVMEYSEAIRVLQESRRNFEYPVTWGIDLQAEHERYLTDEYVKGPLFVINYPKGIKAFYMRLNDDEKTVAAMDVLVPRLGEIIGGSQREERYDVLERRMREVGLDPQRYWWYLELRRYGTAPHAGFGLGLERLLMYVTGMQNIRDVIPFPRYPGYAKF